MLKLFYGCLDFVYFLVDVLYSCKHLSTFFVYTYYNIVKCSYLIIQYIEI